MAYDGIKLDLGCGAKPKDGFIGVDMFHPNAEVRLNLLQFPWPWKDDEVAEIYCSHFVEHIPMCYYPSYTQIPVGPEDRDLLERFFDECYRILHPEGRMEVVCPAVRSNRAFQDPTHRRFIAAETFLYLNREWREANGLSHYSGNCNFGVTVEPIVPAELGLLHPEAAAERINHRWNFVLDWRATLLPGKTRPSQCEESPPKSGLPSSPPSGTTTLPERGASSTVPPSPDGFSPETSTPSP